MRTVVAFAALWLAACSSLYIYEPRGAGSEGGAAPQGAAPGTYIVRAGDTLYSIAWRHGLDHRDLAAWNALGNPDRLAVGQRLVLYPQSRPVAAAAPAVQRPAAPAPAAGAPPRAVPSPSSAPAERSPAARTPPPASLPAWQWPTRGSVIGRFGGQGPLPTGIAIAGELGQDVEAAAAGRVVYVGNGLPDYGQLVIIRHDESWLSAYGHNQRVLVTQDQQVARGQKIAEMGPGPGGRPRLHFEIRQNGDPLDPQGLLPARG